MPGTHVVQLDDATLPADRAAVDCSHNVRSGGRAFSRFVDGPGRRADAGRFPRRREPRRAPRPPAAPSSPARRRPATPPRPAPSATGWPARSRASPGCSPRPSTIRARRSSGSRSSIAPGQSVRLLADGRAGRSDRLRGRAQQRGRHGRGQPLARHPARGPARPMLTAEIRDADGALVETLTPARHLLRRQPDARRAAARPLAAGRRRRHPAGASRCA